jgi:ABC-2 type transport system permease protein
MGDLTRAVAVEMLKARRSRISLFTALGILLLPLAGAFFMIVLKDPELARRVGLISAKAQLLVGAADWPTYLGFLAQAFAAGGLLVFGLIISWTFGREFSDRTAKDLLALPTSRAAIVVSKFIVVAVWCAVLLLLVCVAGLAIGSAIGFPEETPQAILRGLGTVVLVGGLGVVLLTPIAFFASLGRGYLAPMGVIFLIALLSQVIAYAGWGEFFPWSILGLISQGEHLGTVSYVIIALTSVLGIAGTLAWWTWADQAD